MINIKIKEENGILELEAWGHALFDSKGRDIVCASVSVLLQSWVLWERELCGVDLKEAKEEGYLKVVVTEMNEMAKLFFTALKLSLSVLRNQYPEYIKLILEE